MAYSEGQSSQTQSGEQFLRWTSQLRSTGRATLSQQTIQNISYHQNKQPINMKKLGQFCISKVIIDLSIEGTSQTGSIF